VSQSVSQLTKLKGPHVTKCVRKCDYRFHLSVNTGLRAPKEACFCGHCVPAHVMKLGDNFPLKMELGIAHRRSCRSFDCRFRSFNAAPEFCYNSTWIQNCGM